MQPYLSTRKMFIKCAADIDLLACTVCTGIAKIKESFGWTSVAKLFCPGTGSIVKIHTGNSSAFKNTHGFEMMFTELCRIKKF
jgi:hypothetical protein